MANRGMTVAWTSRASAADNSWRSVAYGNGLFVAVSDSGINNRVMTSSDGVVWTSRASAADNNWYSVTYGNGLFVAVAYSGAGNRVMTSPDGITWTLRASAADNSWWSVAYGNGLFVAVALRGAGNRVMTSPDGITWTLRASPNNDWYSVTYGNGMFVAVANTGTGNRVMTSPDGVVWTSRASAADKEWRSVTYGNGLFVAVAAAIGDLNRVMTSPDGIIWTLGLISADNDWYSVTYGSGLFVAVAINGTGNRVMTSDLIFESARTQLRIVYFVELHFSTVERATTWARSLTWGGNTYLAGGNLLTLPDIEESVMISSSSASILLSGVNQANIAIALTENFIDKRLVIMRGFIDTNDQLVIDPVTQFDGRIDNWSLAEDVDQGTSTITWTAASHWIDFDRTSGRTTNDKEHQVLFPGDKFFEFSGETVEIKWGAV